MAVATYDDFVVKNNSYSINKYEGYKPISFKKVMARVHAVIAAIEPHDSIERYTGLGVEVLQGYAKIINPWTVEIALNGGGKQLLTTRNIVIAAGAAGIEPPH